MTARFYQVPFGMIAPNERNQGFRFQFHYDYMAHGHWLNAFEEVADWYDTHFDDPDRTRVGGAGSTLYFKDEDTAFEFKMRFC